MVYENPDASYVLHLHGLLLLGLLYFYPAGVEVLFGKS